MKRQIAKWLAALVAVVVGTTIAAQAWASIAYVVPPGTTGNQNFGTGLGLDFTVTRPIVITRIGAFDSGSDGISGGTTLTTQLWDRGAGPALVPNTTLTFNNADPGTLVGGSRLKPLSSLVLLNPGNYTVASYGYDSANLNGNQGAPPWTTSTGGGALSFVTNPRYGSGGVGVFPNNGDGGPVNRYAAGTFEFFTPLQNATATYSQGGWAVGGAVDTSLSTGWAVAGSNNNTAAFETTDNLGFAGGTELTFVMDQQYPDGQHAVGRFRISVTTDDRSQFCDGLANGGDVTANWTVLYPRLMSSAAGATLTRLPDGVNVVTGTLAKDTYTVTAWTNLTNITGVRLETLYDPTDPVTPGPGRAGNRNHVLTNFMLDLAPYAGAPEWNLDGDGTWSNAVNWIGAVPNAVGAAADFRSVILAPRTVTVDAPHTVGSLNFDNANRYTLAGSNAITLDVASGSAAVNVLAGSHTISAPLVLNDPATVQVSTGSVLTVSGTVGGAGGLTKTGPGTMVVSGLNGYAGGTTVQGGVVTATSSLALGSGDVSVQNGALRLDGSSAALRMGNRLALGSGATLANAAGNNGYLGAVALEGNAAVDVAAGTALHVTGAVSGPGGLTKSGPGDLIVNQTSYGGATVIAEGTLRLANHPPVPTVPVAGAAAWYDATDAGTFTLSGSNVVEWRSKSGANHLAGVNSSGITRSASGGGVNDLAFVNANGTNKNGASYFDLGADIADARTLLAVFKTTTNPNGYTPFFGRNAGEGGNYMGTASGGNGYVENTYSAAGLRTNGATPGQWFLNGQAFDPVGAALSLTDYRLISVSAGANVLVQNIGSDRAMGGRQLAADTGEILIYSNALSAADRQAVEAYLMFKWFGLTLPGFGSGNLPASTALEIGAGGTLDLNGRDQAVASLADHGGAGGVVTNGAAGDPAVLTIGSPAGSTTFTGSINDGAGVLSLVKTGDSSQVLAGASTYSGGTTIGGGTLWVNNTTGSGTGGGAVVVLSGATLGGSGTVAGTVALQGRVSPGASVGTLTTGSQTWSDGGGFTFQIDDAEGTAGGAFPASGWDLLEIAGTLDLSGLSEGGFEIDLVSLLPGGGTNPGDADHFAVGPDAHYEWDFVHTSGGIVGFDPTKFLLDGSGLSNALANPFGTGRFAIVQDGNDLLLTFTGAVPEPSSLVLLVLGSLVGSVAFRSAKAASLSLRRKVGFPGSFSWKKE